MTSFCTNSSRHLGRLCTKIDLLRVVFVVREQEETEVAALPTRAFAEQRVVGLGDISLDTDQN